MFDDIHLIATVVGFAAFVFIVYAAYRVISDIVSFIRRLLNRKN